VAGSAPSNPTYRDLLTEMVITSDNTATDLLVQRIGGVAALNAWLAKSGFSHTRMLNRGHEYRQKLLTLINPGFATLTPEETTGLQYASQDSALFGLYADLFTGARATWVETVRDPAQRRTLAQHRNRLGNRPPRSQIFEAWQLSQIPGVAEPTIERADLLALQCSRLALEPVMR